MESWVRLTILYHLNCAQNSSARACVPSNTAGGTPLMPPFDGAGRAAASAAGPPPPPPPLLHPPVPVALADMGVACWMGVVTIICGMLVVQTSALVDAVVSLGVEVL